MAVEIPCFEIGFLKAGADLSGKQFRCLKVTADETVNIATVAGENILGVLQDKPLAGSPCDIMVLGVTKLIAGAGDLAAGANWESAADGSGITAATAKTGLGTVLIGATAGKLATVTIGIATGGTIA
jgi:hypothetical protein